MAGNIIEYVRWRGDLSFEQSPFNEVDAIVFAQLSYNKIEGLMHSDFDSPLTLKAVAARLKKAKDYHERTDLGAMLNPQSVELLWHCADSARFGDVEVSAFRAINNKESCEQFGGVTFTFGNSTVVALRGTDDYFIGWKEDCNISYQRPIPSQAESLQYFIEAAEHYKDNKLYVTGQSKGGNLALYVGVMAPSELKERIVNVYNFDGPGFPQDFFETDEYAEIKSKVLTYYPEYDVVGMFFKHDSNYIIMKSDQKGILQHDTMSWQSEGPCLVRGKDFTKESKIFEKSINQWADKLSDEEKQEFIDGLFSILLAPGYDTVLEFKNNFLISSSKMLETYAKMDKKTKTNIHQVIVALKKAIKDELPILTLFGNPKLEIKRTE